MKKEFRVSRRCCYWVNEVMDVDAEDELRAADTFLLFFNPTEGRGSFEVGEKLEDDGITIIATDKKVAKSSVNLSGIGIESLIADQDLWPKIK